MRKEWIGAITLAVLGASTVILGIRQAATTSTLSAVQHERDELRSRLEANDQAIADVRAALERVAISSASLPAAARTEKAMAAGDTSELARRLGELALVQSNTLALIERLLTQSSPTPAPETPAQRQASIAVIEKALAEHQQAYAAAREKAHGLLLSLGVPPEVAAMEPGRALDMANLRPYWPFFDAKRERDSMVYLLDRLTVRLAQDKVEFRLQTEKAAAAP